MYACIYWIPVPYSKPRSLLEIPFPASNEIFTLNVLDHSASSHLFWEG